jgi:hypothetical protein
MLLSGLLNRFDDAPIQAHQLVLEAELFPPALAAHQFLAFEQRLLEHRLVKFPRPILIGIGQRGLLGRYRGRAGRLPNRDDLVYISVSRENQT